jgi:hypothetical protein
MPTIKTVNGLAWASMKTRNGLARASIKTLNGADAPASGPFSGLVDVTNVKEHWRLDESSGNRIGAHAGKTLTEIGTVGSVTGPFGRTAARFVNPDIPSGGTTYNNILQLLSDSDFQLGNISFGVSYWARRTEANYPYQCGASIAGSNTGFAFEAQLGGTEGNFYSRPSGGSVAFVQASTTIDVDQWVFFCGWYDAGADVLGCRVNATEGTNTQNSGTDGTLMPFNVGCAEGGSGQDTDLCELTFWKGGFPSSTERAALYNSGAGLQY